ncbi:MAG TPA: 4Fe-4S binding protein [Opitutaceae bacterium]|jgi:NADH-quinone oxidoreductase subunit I|nr:4Fe-4S binding protein [Opitutaceae bacterium]
MKGLLQGLRITARNLVGSFRDPERLTTVAYPEQKLALPPQFRSFPFLVAGSAEDPIGSLRCVACLICQKECPPACIHIERSTDKKPDAAGKPQFYPAQFDIDFSVCMNCGICAEVCPFDAIRMGQDYEIATEERALALTWNRAQLTRAVP